MPPTHLHTAHDLIKAAPGCLGMTAVQGRMASDWLKTAPDHPKIAPGHRKMTSDHERIVPYLQKTVPDRSKMASDRIKMTPDHPKMVPDRSKMASDHIKMAPDRTIMTDDHPKMVPDRSKSVPDQKPDRFFKGDSYHADFLEVINGHGNLSGFNSSTLNGFVQKAHGHKGDPDRRGTKKHGILRKMQRVRRIDAISTNFSIKHFKQ